MGEDGRDQLRLIAVAGFVRAASEREVLLLRSLFNTPGRGEIRDAARLAIQSSVAAAAMYSLMKVLGMPEKFVGVLSAVLVVEPAVGTTLGKAWSRFVATLIGCAIGLLALVLMPDGYGTAAALAVTMLALHTIAGFKTEWRYGVVAAVALALGSESEMMQTAWDRSLAIGLGVAVGVVVSIVVWGERASTRAQRSIDRALESLASYIDETISSVQSETPEDLRTLRGQYQEHMASARQMAEAVNVADDKPLWDQIRSIDSLYGAILIMERVAGEEEDLSRNDSELHEQIEAVRKESCEVTRALSKGESIEGDRLRTIEKAIERIRDATPGLEQDGSRRLLRNVLVFGVGELDESTRRLVELRQEVVDK